MQKDIQLVGLGNALVDIQFEVSDEEISQLGFEKGTMTLVDSLKQHNILKQLGNRTNYKSSGGSAANTMIAYSSFGGKTAYKTMLGNDDLGKFYSKEFYNLGIILDAKFSNVENTGICFVLISPDSERTLVTSLGATALHGVEHIDDSLIQRAEWLYVEGYKFSEQSGFNALKHSINVAKKFETKISLTLSDKFIVDIFNDKVLEVIDDVDLIFCNNLEAKTFTKTNTDNEAFDYLSSKYKNIAMTLGDKGSLIKWNNTVYEIPSYEIKPIDTTGAGDMFAAGFLYGIINWENPTQSGHLGSYAASKVVGQYGARLKESHTDIRNFILDKIS